MFILIFFFFRGNVRKAQPHYKLVLFKSRRQASSNSTTQPNSLPSNQDRYFAVEEEVERIEERKAEDIPAADKHLEEDTPAADIQAADKHPSDNLLVDNLEEEELQSEADLDYNNSSLILPLEIKNRSQSPRQQNRNPIPPPNLPEFGETKKKSEEKRREEERVNGGEDSEGVEMTEKKSGDMKDLYI